MRSVSLSSSPQLGCFPLFLSCTPSTYQWFLVVSKRWPSYRSDTCFINQSAMLTVERVHWFSQLCPTSNTARIFGMQHRKKHRGQNDDPEMENPQADWRGIRRNYLFAFFFISLPAAEIQMWNCIWKKKKKQHQYFTKAPRQSTVTTSLSTLLSIDNFHPKWKCVLNEVWNIFLESLMTSVCS